MIRGFFLRSPAAAGRPRPVQKTPAQRGWFRVAAVLLGLLFLAGCNTEVKPPQGYALIYGVADYEISLGPSTSNYDPNLDYTDDDARAMADLFYSKGWDVKLRIDNGTAGNVLGSVYIPDADVGPATLEQLEADIGALAGVPEGSRFLINISSHGFQATSVEGLEPAGGDTYQEWFFLYSDTPLTIPYSGTHESWDDQVLQDDYLGVLLTQLPEGMKMVVMDTCHSGGLIGDSPTVDPYPQAYQGQEGTISLAVALNRYYNYDPRADILAEEALVLAAAGERESSVEVGGGINHGLFTYHFLQSPALADANGDGWISFGEAADHSISATVDFQESLIKAYQEDPANNTRYFASYLYLPRLTGSGVDFVLFRAD